jgi:hypothetical protein
MTEGFSADEVNYFFRQIFGVIAGTFQRLRDQ